MQTEYNELRQHSKSTWPEATIFASWWTSAEDYILQSAWSARAFILSFRWTAARACNRPRSAAIIPEEDAAYRTFTCRGRRGATLALCGIRSEKARFVAEVLARDFTTSQRQQVIHVASDAPSSELFVVLKKVLPNLRSLSLDAMHIVIVYDQNTNNKRTTGSKWLSVIMNKFRKAHPTRTAASWGAFFDGSQVPTATPDVRAMRLRLDDPDMSEENLAEISGKHQSRRTLAD